MPQHPRSSRALRLLRGVAIHLTVWLLVAAPVATVVFLNSSRTAVVASHEAEIAPTADGWVQVDLGAFLPSLRYPAGSRIGVEVTLGKTSLESYEELAQRYAFLAAQPQGQIAKVRREVAEMALVALGVGAAAGLVGPGLWYLLGAQRRRELAERRSSVVVAVVVGATAGSLVLLGLRPWVTGGDESDMAWRPLASAFPDVRLPEQALPLQVDVGLLTRGTERLVTSALDSYRKSNRFYADAAAEVAAVAKQIRAARDDETVAVLVSDRHDNIGMDPVARAIADAAGATVLLDAGDDTSTGSSWEAFSLESLDKAFEGYDERYYVAGNHDHGGFVTDQAEKLGFTNLDGEVVEGPDGIRLLGVHDPRSSGLGNWRDETGLSFEEVTERLGDVACEADAEGERVSTVLVHDENLADTALERGCVDLVLAGHLHVIRGPERVDGPEGQVGHRFTTGTTGGAAYAIAVGTKPRREATVSLVTYRDGRPVGLQWVQLSPLGDLTVGSWTELAGQPDTLNPSKRDEE